MKDQAGMEAGEFLELLNATGWTADEASARLKVSSEYIYMLRGGARTPSESLKQLLLRIVADDYPALLGLREAPRGLVLHERPEPPSDAERWRRRAVLAERRLSELRSGMRALLASSADPPPPSQAPTAETETASLAEAAARQVDQAGQHSSPVDAPSASSAPPQPGASPPTSPPLAGPAPRPSKSPRK